MECVAYIRVSTERQVEEGYGLESQKRDIEEYCKKNEMLITDWYIDAGLSGMDMSKRVELQRLISDISKINDIVVYKLDRLARDSVDALYMIEKLFTPKGVRVNSVHDFARYETPQDKFQTHIMAAVAEYDRNTMLLRMRGGMLERVKNGYWMGGGNTPYCYRYDKNLGYLVPIPERAEQANRAMDLFIDGMSDVKVQRLLGFKSEQVVRSILTGVVNIGYIPYKGGIYKGLHEPIFDSEKFYLAQELRKSRRKQHIYSYTEPNLLTGMCYCRECGCKMRYQKITGMGIHKIYCCSHDKYLDYLPNYNADCDNPGAWASDVEKAFEQEILEISINLSKYKPKAKETKLQILTNQLEKQKAKLKRLYILYAEGNDMVLDMIKTLETEIRETTEKISAERKNGQHEQKKEFVYENIKKLADIWDGISKSQKNSILKTIIDKVIVGKDDIEIQLKNF
nr:MAG TPA: integrase serine recombinase [Bacteriophage sp.]